MTIEDVDTCTLFQIFCSEGTKNVFIAAHIWNNIIENIVKNLK